MKKHRSISVILAVIMAVMLLASCMGGGTPSATPPTTSAPASTPTAAASPTPSPAAPAASEPSIMNQSGLPVVNEPVTYTAFLQITGADVTWADLEIMQLLEEMTNVHFTYDTADELTYRERLTLSFTAGNYADVLFGRGRVRWQEDEEFGREGYLIDLRDLMDEWMPNIQAFYAAYPFAKAGSTASDGNIYGFPLYYGGPGGNPMNCYMDDFWIGATGRTDVPDTTDELWEFLVDIKALMTSTPEYNYMYPIGARTPPDSASDSPIFAWIFRGFTGVIASWASPWAAPDNKTMQFMWDHPGYRAAVEFVRDAYQQGFIEPECFVIDGPTLTARFNEATYAIFQSSPTTLGANARGNGESMRPLTSQYNDRKLLPYEQSFRVNQMNITDKCKNPEILARWADFFYDLNPDPTNNDIPNALMMQLGLYGKHWAFSDQKFDGREAWTFLDRPDGTKTDAGSSTIDWTWLYANITPGWNGTPGYRMNPYLTASTDKLMMDKQFATIKNQDPYLTTDTQFSPYARIAAADEAAIVTRRTDLQEYIHRTIVEFITGVKDVNANWDAFISDCNRIAGNDFIDAYQRAYDAWIATQ